MEYKKYGLLIIGIFILDQLTKFIIRSTFSIGETRFWILTYIQNTGAAFGMLQEKVYLLSWISLIALGILVYLFTIVENHFKLPLALILGGTIGNGVDRFLFHYVVDFIDFRVWPAFNIADSAITIGGVMIFWYLLKEK
ncbi:signal peptidase II [Candidatus Woesearchaeota archaeon]|nr:signal peptidase II [Candidatus Woesearchaeota archaeon]